MCFQFSQGLVAELIRSTTQSGNVGGINNNWRVRKTEEIEIIKSTAEASLEHLGYKIVIHDPPKMIAVQPRQPFVKNHEKGPN